MGNPFLIQACLRLNEEDIPKNLEIGKEYPFQKDGHRIYQLNVPMDLRKENWDFICRIVIVKYGFDKNKTKGIFVPVKFFNEEEKKIITKTYVSDEEVREIIQSKAP